MVIAALPEDDGTRAHQAGTADTAQRAAQPSWEQLLVPLLRLLNDGRVQQLRVLQQVLTGHGPAHHLGPASALSGHSASDDRVSLAVAHLARADAVERPSRGQYRITETGRQILAEFPDGLTQAEVEELAGYAATRRRSAGRHERVRLVVEEPGGRTTTVDAVHQIGDGLERLRETVTAELLQRLHAQDLEAFGATVLTLLEAMGYGAQGRRPLLELTQDGGVEAVIDDDPLGLSRIYLQAKRLAPTGMPTGRPVVQAFVREVQRRGLVQGMFVTTGRLTADAWTHAQRATSRVLLVDGEALACLMMRYSVGVRPYETLRLLEVDEEFFA
ncbi:restriction endonuclease [Actinomyces wuliandei]|uniref:restriction endonuclease n=1 Tax=Actinomyces wuliandei TaxID=2057743 RepID=UPI000FD72341|nr:restriction endonuclease [Actinomyces wuliandei]